MNRWQQYVNSRLDAMRDVAEGMIFEGTYPNVALIKHAREQIPLLLRDSTPTPSVVPGCDPHDYETSGTVLLVWHSKGGLDVELEISFLENHLWARSKELGWSVTGTFPDVKPGWEKVLDLLEENLETKDDSN